jgi:ornithine cyclodeaminase/alanine dehydrogenase-like protein (mu-crystallin family)
VERLTVLGPDETRAALADGAALTGLVARALVAVARGTASVPPRIAAVTGHGLLGAMPGYVPGVGLGAKLISVFDDPARPGRSSHQGLVAIFDEQDGRPLAILDAEPLTAARTAASATVALRALARPDARRAVVVGTGTQARAQLELLAADPRWEVTLAGRDPEQVAVLAERFRVDPAPSIEAGVRAAEAVLCCTGAREPVLRARWLAPGTHVSSVGGSQGPELDSETVAAGSLFAEWPGAAESAPPAGAHELQGVDPARVTLIGSVLDGTHPGRRDEGELTVYKSTGHASLDLAAAAAVRAALAAPRAG